MRLFLSLVGTSALTNPPTEDKVKEVLLKTSNCNEKELSADDKRLIDEHAEYILDRMNDADEQEWRKRSAEINGLLSYGHLSDQDYHILLTTDTYQGIKSAEIVEKGLSILTRCNQIKIITPKDLSTHDTNSFMKGMVDVVEFCDDTIKGFRESKYEIIFNLTGGFKAIQGYMNTLGMLYADEIIYTFESKESSLIKIPKLPLEMNLSLAKKHAATFGVLDKVKELDASKLDISGISEAYVESINVDDIKLCSLTVWGKLLWKKCKNEVLSQDLYDWPYFIVEDSFKKDFNSIKDVQLRIDIQDTIAKASALLIANNGNIGVLKSDGGLQYKIYTNKKAIGHFRINDARRISCMPDNGKIRLRHCGEHNYVNNNP